MQFHMPFNRNQIKGSIFLIGGVALIFFAFDILSCLSSLILMAFSLVLVAYGLMKGHFIETLRKYVYSSKQENLNNNNNNNIFEFSAKSFEREHVKAVLFSIGGALLFLYASGILASLTKLLIIILAILLILYGLKLTDIINILSKKTKEQEAKNEIDDRKFKS